MNIENLPNEVLEIILKNMKGTEVAACRAVCRRWRGLIDSLSEATWAHFCRHECRSLRRVKPHCNLTYQDLYRSLALWNQVEDAKLRKLKLPINAKVNIARFRLLYDSIGVAIEKEFDEIFSNSKCDTIQYYHLLSLKYIRSERYPFLFDDWNENENIFLLIDLTNKLHVMVKSNSNTKIRPEFIFDLLDTAPNAANVVLENDAVIFLNKNFIPCVARLKVFDGKKTIETEELATLINHPKLIAFANAGTSAVNILTSSQDPQQLNIYCVQKDSVHLCDYIKKSTQNKEIKLKEFGFDWTDTSICRVFESAFGIEENYMPHMRNRFHSTIVHTHHNVVLIGSLDQNVYIFKNAYQNDGELILREAPNRSIDILNLRTYLGRGDGFTEIMQLDAIEILYGHRIFVLTQYKMFIYDLFHKQNTSLKRCRIDEDGQSTSANKRRV